MDFHNMKRKELQKLCKKHDIPANLSNLEMVDKLSSIFKVQEEEKVKPMRKTRSCLKNSDEMLSENESDVLKKNLKKVRFSPENDVFQLGEKSERGFVAENKGGAGRVTRGRASLLCKTISISPVVMKRKGKRAVQEVEKEDLVVENRGGASRVTRARASLGKNVVISSPVVMKKRAKKAVQEIEKKDVDVESKGAVGRVTRARALVDEKVPITSPVVMKKRGKKAVQEDDKGESVSENQGGASRVTRARAGKQVLIPSPVVMKKRGKQAVQEDEKGDLIVENKGGASRVTRARAGKQVLISSPVVMKKRGKRAVQEEKKSGSGQFLVVDFTNPGVEEENEVITVKFLRNRKVENVVSPKNIVRKRNMPKRSQTFDAEVSENKDAEADGGITRPKMGLRRSTRNVNISEESERLMDEADQVSRKNSRQSSRQRASAKSSVEDVDIKTVAVEISQPEVVTRQSKRNRQLTDESTMYQTRRGTKRMSVLPQTKKAKTEKPVAGNLGKKNIVVKDSPNESTKSMVEKGSEAGHVRRSKRNASGDGSPVSAEDVNGSGTNVKTVTTKKRRREAILEEVPSQQTGRRINRKADNISDKLTEKTPVASEPRTRSGNGQASLMHSAKKLNVSGNLGPSRTAGEKASPHHTRELSTVPKRSGTGARQLKTVAVTPQSRSGSGQKSFTRTTKKLRKSGTGLHSSIGDKESPHHSREISTVPRRSETVSKGKGSKSKHTPVVHEHSRRFTRSALKGKTDGPAYGRGKIHQKKSQSVSKLPVSKVESSLPKATSEGPLDIDVQSSYQEIDRSTVNFVSNASDLPEDKTACSTPQGGSPKTSSADLNVQKSKGSEMINIHEVSHSARLNLQSNHSELEVDISTPQGGSPKTTGVDLNVQESEGPEMMNMCEASPSDPLNLQNNYAEIEVDISTPQGGSPKICVNPNLQELEGPELINVHEALPSDPLNLQVNHAELKVDISTAQVSSPKTSSVDLNVQESEGPELINIREASPGDPLNVQSNDAEPEVDISTPRGGSPKTTGVDLKVQESEGSAMMNMCEASPSDPLNLQNNYAEIKVDISTPQGGSPKIGVDLNLQELEGPELINVHEALPSDPLNLQVNHGELEVDISTAQVSSPKTSSVDLNVQESECPELINIREASPGDPLNVQSNDAEPEVDISTPEGGSPKTSSVDLNVHESEGPESRNIREASPSDTNLQTSDTNLQINHAVYGDVYEDNTTATQRENSCETNVASPHLVDLEVDAAAGDGFPADINTLPDNSLAELSTSTRREERPQLSNDVESVSKEIDLNLFFQGPAILEDEPVNHSPFGEVAETADNPVTGESDAACVTQQEGPAEIDARSPPLGHLKSSDDLDIIGNAGSFDTGSVDDFHLNVEHINSSTIKEEQEVSKNVNHVVAEGSTCNEEKSTAEVGDCGPTEQEHEILKHPAKFAESGRLDKESNSASKEVGEAVSFADIFCKTVSMDFTEDKDDKMHPEISVQADEPHNTSSKSGLQEKEFPVLNSIANTEEVSILEYDIRNHPSEFAESDQLDKDSNSASKEVGEAESFADIFNQTVSMNFTEDRDDKMHPEISVQADEPPNTSSKSEMQEKEFPVTNSITNTEEVSILEYEFSKPEFCDTVTSTVMRSNKELEEDNKQRLSTLESCLVQGEGCTNIFIEFSTSNVVADSVAGEENNSEPIAPSSPLHATEFDDTVVEVNEELKPEDSPLHATEFDNTVVEVNEELKPEDSPLSWSSDILKRADVDGSDLQKERNSAKSVDVSEHSCSKNAKVKSENRKKVGAFDSSAREMSDMPEFTSSLPSHVTELGQLVAEVKELKPKDLSSLLSTENVPKWTAEDGSSLRKRVGSEGREVEETVFEDTVEIDSERTSSMFGDAHHTLDSQPMERESVLEETMCSISGDVKERRMNKNISRERTPVISEDDVDRENISCPVIVHEFPSIVDHCHAPSEDSCGKEQGTDMSMVKSSKNFGKEFPTQHDNCHGSLDSCWKEQGTPMSIVKSGKNCCQEFSGQHDKIIEQVKVCSAAALPQTICEDYAGFGREMVADLMGSTIKHISRIGDLSNEKFEEIEPCTIINDKIVLGDGIESLKRNSSNLAQNLVEDSGGYYEKSASEVIIRDVSEEDRYGKDTVDSHRFEDSLQQFDVNYGGIDSNSKGICQENDKRPCLVQMDVDTNNVESSRDNLFAGDTVHRFDREPDASAVPTEEHPRCDDAVDANAPAKLLYGGESVPLTGENEAEGVPTEELTRIEDAMDAEAPANLQYGRESLTIIGETNQAQERGPEEITFCSDIFGSELKSGSDEVGVDREVSHLWFDDTSFMLDKSEDTGKGLDVFMVSATKEQLHNSGEEHVRVGNQHATAIYTPGNRDDNVSVENSGGTLIESQLESEANKDAHQKVDCYNNNKSDEKFTGTES